MAGAGYKLFNTGDVLLASEVNTYLQQQTVMVFASSTARTTALSGVLAEGMMSYLQDTNSVEVYNGSSWVNVGNAGDITGVTAGTGISGGGSSGDVTITNSMATAIDAKGDLIVGTGADTFARLAVGANDTVLTADSSTATGLKWAAPAGGATFVGANVYATSAQSISNATDTVVNFDNEYLDTDSFHDNSTNNSRITIPSGKDGKYLIYGQVAFASNVTGQRSLNIFKNGSILQKTDSASTFNGFATVLQMTIASLVATDYIQLSVYQNSGGSLNTRPDGTQFMVVYLGA